MKGRRVWRWIAVAVVVLVLGAAGAMAYLQRPRPAYNVDATGLALGGYDPVSYFPEGGGQPVAGEPRFTATHEGRRYQFASDENRQRFVAAPERFAPQFGGWCAYAVANGYKFEVEPTSYLIEDGRLLVFYKGVLGDARGEFTKEGAADGLHRADANWPKLAKD